MSTLKTNAIENIAGTMTYYVAPPVLHTLTADTAISFTGIPSGTSIWQIELDANGFTVTWDASVEWDGDGVEPEWSTDVDLVQFYTTDGGTTIKGMQTRAGA